MQTDKSFTQNDISELLDILQKAVKVNGPDNPVQGMHGYSKESMDILDNIMGRVPSFSNTVFGPILQQLMCAGAESILKPAKALGDRYGKQIEEDINNNRYDRITILIKMSVLNQLRLSYGREQHFSPIRDFVAEKYHEDIIDKDSEYGFVPERSEASKALWGIVDSLVDKGVVTVLDDVGSDDGVKTTIIRMERSI